jgi:DNA mismatch endonuclease (patch repair protein)
MDSLTEERRGWNMSRIKGRDTKPELAVRSALHRLGFRFRLHRRDLPGTPDVTLPRHRTAVFVHGCYWHRHADCAYAYRPKTRVAFWQSKFDANVKRDARNQRRLCKLGWRVLIVWECATKQDGALVALLDSAMNCTESVGHSKRTESVGP